MLVDLESVEYKWTMSLKVPETGVTRPKLLDQPASKLPRIEFAEPEPMVQGDCQPALESEKLHSKLNWLRAGVLGANDGIVSIAGLVMGIAGAQTDSRTLLIAGLAGLVSGALSMAGGEYVSVSSQKDTESAALNTQRDRLSSDPDGELQTLARLYEDRGISKELSTKVAEELTGYDALAAHAEIRLGIDSDEVTSPMHAAVSSLVAFTVGGLIPLLLMVLTPAVPASLGPINVTARVWATLFGVVLALCLTGFASATFGGGPKWRPMVRNVFVGLLGMVVTYGVGTLFRV